MTKILILLKSLILGIMYIHLSIQQIFSAYYVMSTVIDTRNIMLNKENHAPTVMEYMF